MLPGRRRARARGAQQGPVAATQAAANAITGFPAVNADARARFFAAVAHELRSPLQGRGLDEALRQRAQELTPLGRADIRVEGRAPTLPPLVAAHATRIAGEALTNAVRHAGAQRISVELGGSRKLLRITVRDDGRGLPDELRPGSNGLRSMRERAATIGGTLEVEHADGGGTVVALQVPLNAIPQEVS
ncbi:MAG: hypothetical protein KY463_09650 [Actinobacteria bacterium]|nr:hypothetical protein [Actinomycetota bacterium]